MTMTKKKKRIVGAALLIGIPVMAALMIYIIISVYYMHRFFPGTWINGLDCGNKTVNDVKKELEEYHSNYIFRIIERGGSQEVLGGADIGHKIVFEGIEDLKKEQGIWNWPVKLTEAEHYSAEGGHGYDEAKLKSALEKLDCMTKDVVEPQNAYIDFSDGIKIVPEIEGNKVDIEKLYEVVGKAITDGESRLDIDAAGCYIRPEVTQDSESFKKEIKPIKDLTKAKITLTIGPDTEVIDSKVSESFLTKDDSGKIGIDRDKVKTYMEKIEKEYQTWGEPHEFKTTEGNVVSLKGSLGWSIDVERETDKIIEELKAGKDVEREALYDSTAPTWEGNEIGDTYLEISISGQHMWFYKDGKLLVDTDIVTGSLNKGYGTPTGAYKLLNKQRNVTLVGANPDDPYESKVSYWLPFIGNLYGVHDASWRSSYGGTIYYNNGSHGCVNTPYSKVQQIYENIEINTPVLIY